MMMVVSDSGKEAGTVRPAAVAGAFYPANAGELQAMIDRQMNHARRLVSSLAPRLPQGAPKAVIVPHAGYVYSGSVAALAYALLERTPHSAGVRGEPDRARLVRDTVRPHRTRRMLPRLRRSGSRPLVRGRRI